MKELSYSVLTDEEYTSQCGIVIYYQKIKLSNGLLGAMCTNPYFFFTAKTEENLSIILDKAFNLLESRRAVEETKKVE